MAKLITVQYIAFLPLLLVISLLFGFGIVRLVMPDWLRRRQIC